MEADDARRASGVGAGAASASGPSVLVPASAMQPLSVAELIVKKSISPQ
jgi:hypothetical protein